MRCPSLPCTCCAQEDKTPEIDIDLDEVLDIEDDVLRKKFIRDILIGSKASREVVDVSNPVEFSSSDCLYLFFLFSCFYLLGAMSLIYLFFLFYCFYLHGAMCLTFFIFRPL